MNERLEDIKADVERIARSIGAPTAILPQYEYADGPYVDIDRSGQLYYICTDRGIEVSRVLAFDKEHLLYKIFSGITHQMASRQEAKERKPDVDHRRLLFTTWIEMMDAIDKVWGERTRAECDSIVRMFPFRDGKRF